MGAEAIEMEQKSQWITI